MAIAKVIVTGDEEFTLEIINKINKSIFMLIDNYNATPEGKKEGNEYCFTITMEK